MSGVQLVRSANTMSEQQHIDEKPIKIGSNGTAKILVGGSNLMFGTRILGVSFIGIGSGSAAGRSGSGAEVRKNNYCVLADM